MEKERAILIEQLSELDIRYGWSKKFSIESLLAGEQNQTIDKNPPLRKPTVNEQSLISSIAPSTPSISKFSKDKYHLTRQYFAEFNRLVFDNKLPSDMEVTWSKRLTKTAGFTRLKKAALSVSARSACIELSEKVLDDPERLRQTLAHEMCHAAQWLIDGVSKPPHGNCFWKWAKHMESRVTDISVTTCHTYEINTPFKFMCTNDDCCKVYSRHSKKGIDVNRQVCGICRSTLLFTGEFLADGTPKKSKPASGFSLFVKEHYATVKAARNLQTHGDVMSALSAKYKEAKSQQEEVNDGDEFALLAVSAPIL